MSNRRLHIIHLLGILGILFGFAGCANQGAPEGGPFDVTPPRLIKAFPEQGARNVSENRIVLRFDEFIKLVNQQDKLIISPPQKTAARISASGKVVDIHLEDTLKPNTTYSFYFDDALVDNNEDNPLEDFSYSFSTGETLDSMQLLGTVLDAQTLEPVQNLVIGAHFASTKSDTLLRNTPMPFVSKTNRTGQFVIRGLRDSSYLVFALKDDDNDFRYSQPTEGLAFDDQSYKTWLIDSIRTDTIRIDSIVRRDTLHRDSLVTYPYTYYHPRNLLLRYFVSDVKRMGIERYDRLDSLVCRIEFASTPDSIPTMRLLDYPKGFTDHVYIASMDGKGINYWLRDSLLMQADSLRFGITYAKTDSLMQITSQTDTLTFYKPKASSRQKKKDKQEGFTVKLEAS
ncbi:MAG: Ig-like domain-containing protein, partial [Porphyromonadaceae bacterium]|nr:Ig-like domain-containing protein [Porphyromonadaceae bacterium]